MHWTFREHRNTGYHARGRVVDALSGVEGMDKIGYLPLLFDRRFLSSSPFRGFLASIMIRMPVASKRPWCLVATNSFETIKNTDKSKARTALTTFLEIRPSRLCAKLDESKVFTCNSGVVVE